MLDDRTRTMLEVANTLTAEDLEFIRSDGVVRMAERQRAPRKRAQRDSPSPAVAVAVVEPPPAAPAAASATASSRGEYERKRTRESKVSTECLGEERVKHEWWPLGTELIGQIGTEFFTAVVVENTSVKSGRALRSHPGRLREESASRRPAPRWRRRKAIGKPTIWAAAVASQTDGCSGSREQEQPCEARHPLGRAPHMNEVKT